MRYASLSRDTHTCAMPAATYKCCATNSTNHGCCLPTHRLPCQRFSLSCIQDVSDPLINISHSLRCLVFEILILFREDFKMLARCCLSCGRSFVPRGFHSFLHLLPLPYFFSLFFLEVLPPSIRRSLLSLSFLNSGVHFVVHMSLNED